jgi:hypothetical protein
MITEKEIEAKDIKRLLLRVYRRYNSGAITEAQAYKEAYPTKLCIKSYRGNRPGGEITKNRNNAKRLSHETNRYRENNKTRFCKAKD